MTTTTTPSPASRAALPALDDRGTLTISDSTVERIAARAVTEIEGVGGAASRVLGVAVGGEDLDNTAKVSAKVSGETADLDVRLSVAYFFNDTATTENARRQLMRRVAEYTGLTVSRVDITVTALHTATAVSRRVQ